VAEARFETTDGERHHLPLSRARRVGKVVEQVLARA
jgi:hypothetical protein